VAINSGEDLTTSIDIAYTFLKKSHDEDKRLSYEQVECLSYLAQKNYIHHKDELLFSSKIQNSSGGPLNLDISIYFSKFKGVLIDIDKIIEFFESKLNYEEQLIIDYVWMRYSKMSKSEILKFILADQIFYEDVRTISKEDFHNMDKDKNLHDYIIFLMNK